MRAPAGQPAWWRTRAIDTWAAVLSNLCLVHCLLLPLALLLLPALALTVGPQAAGLHGALHWGLLGLALPVSALALASGFARHHHLAPMLLAAIGFAIMAGGAAAHGGTAEPLLTVGGGVLIALAHWRNRRPAHCPRHAPAVS